MSIARPTFHESWYRVADLRPTLRPLAQIVRQRFRGRIWYVLHDEIADTHHRITAGAYRFIALLDGRRTVDEAWRHASEQLGDDAPTQGEAIRALGQLAQANLLTGDVPPDASLLLERAAERRRKERAALAKSYLFIRIPIWDPDRWLSAWSGLSRAVWSRWMWMPWLGVMLLGALHLFPNSSRLIADATTILEAGNLLPLYLAFMLAKLVHELAHASACKGLLRRAGLRGGVHQIGIMLLVLFPMPYVDASAATSLPRRSHRMLVAGAGMIAELALAALAAIVWARTASGTFVHEFAYNLLFIGSISTLLFNLNPLLRFDGYYILSDALSLANLAQRSREMLFHLVRRKLWGLRTSTPPTNEPREAGLLLSYAIASFGYRTALLVGIIVFVSAQAFILGVLFALGAAVIWFVLPLYKFIAYLSTDAALAPRRARAVALTACTAALLLVLIGLIPFPRSTTLSAVAQPADWRPTRSAVPGFIHTAQLESGPVQQGAPLAILHNTDLLASESAARSRLLQASIREEIAATESPALASIASRAVEAARAESALSTTRAERLSIVAEQTAHWWPNPQALQPGRFVEQDTVLGSLFNPQTVVLRALADRNQAGRLAPALGRPVRIRGLDSPVLVSSGALRAVAPAGVEQQRGANAQFEIVVVPDQPEAWLPGQRCRVRVALPPRTLWSSAKSWLISAFGERLPS